MPNQGNKGVPGNTIESQAAFDRQVYEYGKMVMKLNDLMRPRTNDAQRVKALKVKCPVDVNGEWFLILTMQSGEEPLVAFSSGSSLIDALTSLVNRNGNGTLKWRVDEYG